MEDIVESSPESPIQTSNQELMRPLQETAERISKRLEGFATILDKFQEKKELEGQALWESVWSLMDEYSKVARADSENARTSSLTKQMLKNRKSADRPRTQKEDLELEADLWSLTSQILPCQCPDMMENLQFKENGALADLHRYSSNAEIFEAFMEVDRIANQYELLLEWLQDWRRKHSQKMQDSDFESQVEPGRGDGIWSDGNAFTKLPIKRRKIERAHPGPLPPSPAIRDVHRRETDNEILVTEMDIDAAKRQDAHLAVEDEAWDGSAWHATWELLRRGIEYPESDTDNDPRKKQSWWRDRKEQWRDVIIRNPDPKPRRTPDVIWRRVMSLASNQDYWACCKELLQSDLCNDEYERAVYGIMSGKYNAAKPVCKSIDDHFFALLNELFIERFEHFVTAYRKRLQDPELNRYSVPESTVPQITKCFTSMQSDPTTRAEAQQPIKYLQGMLFGDDVGTSLLELGHAAAQKAHLTGEAKALFDKDETKVSESAHSAVKDPELVRMVVHLQLGLQPLGLLDEAYAEDKQAMENNIINYIALLEQNAKYSLLPLYTSHIHPDRQPRTLGRILAKVTEPKERDLQMRLMKQYNIPVYRVIYTICDYARRSWLAKLRQHHTEPLRFTEREGKFTKCKTDFIGIGLDEDESHVLQAHEWVNYIDTQNWGMAVWLMTALYKNLFMSGRIAAAKELSSRVDLAKTSLKVTGMNLGLAALVQDHPVNGEKDSYFSGSDHEGEKVTSPTKRRKGSKQHLLAVETTDRKILTQQSVTWAHLEHLVLALEQLEEWQGLAEQVNALPKDDRAAMKIAKRQLTEALGAVQAAMQPLLEKDFLTNANDQQEEDDLQTIRKHYLPECIFAYNSALYFAGHAISRQHLVQCMELAQHVAKNDTLTDAFVQSKRMQELVMAFALDSQALLRANEQGGVSKAGRKQRTQVGEHGGRADIWQVTWKDD